MKRAREARADLGCAPGAPIADVVELIEEAGGAHVVVLELPDGVAGAYLAREGCPLLIVNGSQALPRQRFTVAHEFGHHRMGHASVVDKLTVILGGQQRDPNEISANAFAAEFLMPRDGITAWAAEHVTAPVTLEHVVLLACEFGVSAQAARYALTTAGVLPGGPRCDALDSEIAAEEHVELFGALGLQPLHDELADSASRLPRIPRELRDTAFGDLLAGSLDVDGLADAINREPGAVREMLTALGLDQLVPAAF